MVASRCQAPTKQQTASSVLYIIATNCPTSDVVKSIAGSSFSESLTNRLPGWPRTSTGPRVLPVSILSAGRHTSSLPSSASCCILAACVDLNATKKWEAK